MTNNIFLQLREKTAEITNGAGDFTTKLQKPMKIEQGDEIIMNKAIIDSRAVNSGKILLEEDTNFKIYFNYYLINYDTQGKTDRAGNAWTTSDIDGQVYVLSEEWSHGSSDVFNIARGRMQTEDSVTFPVPISVVYEIYPVGSTTRIPIVLNFNNITGSHPPWGLYTDDVNIQAVKKPGEPLMVRISTDAEIKYWGGDPNSIKIDTEPVGNRGSHWQPVVNSKEITIPKGSYDPTDIAERISEKFTELRTPSLSGFIDQPEGNALLQNTESTYYKGLKAGNLFIKYNGEVNATSGGSPYQYKGAFQYRNSTANDHYFFGTSQFTLIYDNQTNRFKLSYLHFPYYDSGGQLAVAMKEIQGTNTNFWLVNKLGGILIQGLESNVNGVKTKTNYWSDKLGFDLGTICVAPSHKESAYLSAPVPFWTGLQDGVNMTGGEIGIDTTIDKTAIPKVPDLINIKPTISPEQTLGIAARGDFGIINLESGYFLIEIRGLNSQLITNSDIKGHILGIVSRYYESENYTTGTDADAIVYRHASPEPLYINELSVRILNSDYQLATIGDDNTIFLQLLKAPKKEIEQKK